MNLAQALAAGCWPGFSGEGLSTRLAAPATGSPPPMPEARDGRMFKNWDRRAQILEFVRRNGTVSGPEVARALDMKRPAASMMLSVLRRQKFLRSPVRGEYCLP